MEEEGDSRVCREKQRCEMHINAPPVCSSVIPHRKVATARLTWNMQEVAGFPHAASPCREWYELNSILTGPSALSV